MRVLFCYDGPLRKDSENNYYGIVLSNNFFKRYEAFSKDISIAMRVNTISEDMKTDNLSKILYNVIELPNISNLNGILFKRRKCYKILKKEIEKSDLIIIRMPSMIGNIAFKISKELNKKTLIEMVGCPFEALWYHGLKGKLIAPFMWYKTKHNLKKAYNVIYVTNKFLQKRYPTLGYNVGCSDVELLDANENVLNERIQKIRNQKNNNKIILGTLAAIDVKYKGQEYVIKAISELKNEGYNFEYQLVGGGNKEKLEKLAIKLDVKDDVKFLGVKPHNEIFEWLDNIDVYIQPSNTEGMPRALIEAMSRACPCIGSNVGEISNLLDKECIFRKKNYNKLKEILRSFDNEKRIIYARNNFKKSQNYLKDKLKKVREEFYRNLK